ncbi:Class D sortase, partial [Dysosmobacter welbionis]
MRNRRFVIHHQDLRHAFASALFLRDTSIIPDPTGNANRPFPSRREKGRAANRRLRPAASKVQELLYIPVRAQNQHRLPLPEAVVAARNGDELLSPLGGQDVDIVPLAHPQLADGLAHPGRRHRRLVNGVVRRQLDVVKDMVGAVPHRRPAGGLPLRINHVIRAVAQQKFGVDIPCRPGQDEACALLLQQGRGLQRALEVVSNGHHAQVKVPHPQGGDERLAGAVPDLRVGHQVQRLVDPLLVFVHRQHLVVQLL